MKIKIAHCSDIHIGVRCGNFDNEVSKILSEDTKRAFFDMLKICDDEEVDAVLIAGDLFDSTNVKISDINNLISEIKKYKFKIFISPGNHDPFTPDSPYVKFNWPENVFIFKERSFEKIILKEKETIIFGNAFQGAYEYSRTLKDFDSKEDVDDKFINICLTHGDLNTFGESKYGTITTDDISLSKMDYVALGHIHKRTEILSADSTYYAYSGNLQGTGFDELGEKGFYIGTVGEKQCNLEFRKICRRTFEIVDVDVTGCQYTSDFEDRIFSVLKEKHDYSKNLYKIFLKGEIGEGVVIDIPLLISFLKDKIFYVNLIDKTNVKIDFKKLHFRNDFKSEFIKKMLFKIENSKDDIERKINNEALKIGLAAIEEALKEESA